MSSSFSPGMMGATMTPTRIPALASLSMVRTRRAGVATKGSIARACSVPERDAHHDATTRATRVSSCEHVDVALDERRLGDDAARGSGTRRTPRGSRA